MSQRLLNAAYISKQITNYTFYSNITIWSIFLIIYTGNFYTRCLTYFYQPRLIPSMLKIYKSDMYIRDSPTKSHHIKKYLIHTAICVKYFIYTIFISSKTGIYIHGWYN